MTKQNNDTHTANTDKTTNTQNQIGIHELTWF